MITNDQLLKLFVLVPSTVENFNGATVSGAANEHRIFFEESTGLIWAKGKSFGGNDSELAAIVNTLIGADTDKGKSIRTIAGEVLAEAMDLADDADTTINNLTEVLKWFKDLPEEEEGALNLIARLGKPAVLYTATDEEVIGGTKQVGDVKEVSTGVFALIDALKTRVSTAEGKITALETTVGDSTSGLVKDVADNATAIGQLKTTVGDSTSGLVKNVADNATAIGQLKTTVGDDNNGLVKSVADNATAIGQLKTTVGDDNSGLVKSVNDLKTTVGDSTFGLVKDVADINSTIEQNELTTATALTQLNTRVNALEQFDPWENYVAPTNSEPTPEP